MKVLYVTCCGLDVHKSSITASPANLSGTGIMVTDQITRHVCFRPSARLTSLSAHLPHNRDKPSLGRQAGRRMSRAFTMNLCEATTRCTCISSTSLIGPGSFLLRAW